MRVRRLPPPLLDGGLRAKGKIMKEAKKWKRQDLEQKKV